jgi:hypothetical protein
MSAKMRNNYPELRNIGVVMCGGNIDVTKLPWYQQD